jgi:hypothetical protein
MNVPPFVFRVTLPRTAAPTRRPSPPVRNLAFAKFRRERRAPPLFANEHGNPIPEREPQGQQI